MGRGGARGLDFPGDLFQSCDFWTHHKSEKGNEGKFAAHTFGFC